jgi:hypothetical protein
VINEGEVVTDHLSAFVNPDLAAQLPITSSVGDFVDFVNDFSMSYH